MHYQGDLLGQVPLWGYVEGGMGQVSFAIAQAARDLSWPAGSRWPRSCPAKGCGWRAAS